MGDSEEILNVTAVNDTVYIEATGTGAGTDYSYLISSYSSAGFDPASFSDSFVTGNLTLTGGAAEDGGSQTPVYSYTLGYDPVGNVLNYSDSVMGTWGYSYDTLNRLQTAQPTATTSMTSGYANQYLCWAYDSFGNRTAQSLQPAACPAEESSLTPTESYNSSNQISDGLLSFAKIPSGRKLGLVFDFRGRLRRDLGWGWLF